MKKYAVAFVSFFENDLQIKIVQADNWWEALGKAFGVEKVEFLGDCKDLEEARVEAFNQDWLFGVVEI